MPFDFLKIYFLGLEIQFDAKDYIFNFSAKIGDLRPNLYALLVMKPFL